jgi:limonene-1,2-epoxide hydrolase
VEAARVICDRLLEAVHDRDADGVVACFVPDGSWQNVPHPSSLGRTAIRAVFDRILTRSERVQWDVVNAVYEPHRAWLERVDRFWIDGTEYAVECNGVFEVDEDAGLLVSVRDYVDLGLWRAKTERISW